ncbi:hypothetical protein AWE51_16550 [Aquimarina aggregata]|uniref:Uncharacterized protein n=1 Tax=Aquimarina aggregata TaxID=1642818 RepID=A0A163D353_9FLAO|nr:hypothetical protein AWE51_16550 [Aquimarina aggregata]
MVEIYKSQESFLAYQSTSTLTLKQIIFNTLELMKKSILNLEGVKIIKKKAQRQVNGGSGCNCGSHETSPGSCLCHTSV